MNKSEKTRQYIIEKAAVIFNKYGFVGTSMSDLTEAIGLTKGAIYGNFKSKDEIAIAAFDHNADQLIMQLMNDLQEKKEPIDKLLAIPHYFLKAYEENSTKGGCPLLNSAIDSDDTHPELHKRVNTTITILKELIIENIAEGKLKDHIKTHVDSEKIASLFIALIEGGNMLAKTTGKKKYLLDSLTHIEDLILYTLKK